MLNKLIRLFAFMLALIITFTSSGYESLAKEVIKLEKLHTEGDFVLDEGEYKNTGIFGYIKEYRGSGGTVEIPATINNIDVQAIGKEAFKGKQLKNVVIPNTVKIIGEEAFSDNSINFAYVPDSVTTIEKGAFSKNIISTWDEGSKETNIVGMKNVTRLEDGAFSEIFKLSLDIPACKEINENAFVPYLDKMFSKADYPRLYTRNNNTHNLESLEGKYLIDPAVVNVRPVDSETGYPLFREGTMVNQSYPSSFNRSYGLDNFKTIGETESFNILDDVKGYARPKNNKKNINMEKDINYLEFEYIPIKIAAPYKIPVDSQKIEGKTTPGAQVILTLKEGYYGGEEIGDTIANDKGFFSLEINKELNVQSKLSLTAKVTGEYEGNSNEHIITIGEGHDYGVESIEILKPISVKQGTKGRDLLGALKKVITLYDTQGVEIKKEVFWQHYPNEIEEVKDYYAIGLIRVGENVLRPIQKIVVKENLDIIETDKVPLLKEIENCRNLINSVSVSKDGKDILPKDKWITQENKDIFLKEINKAKKISEDNTVEQEKVNTTLENLLKAKETFTSNCKDGILVNETEKFGKMSLYIRVQDATEDEKGEMLGVKVKNTSTGAVYELTKYGIEMGSEVYEFSNLPFGQYKVLVPEGYIVVYDGDLFRRLPESELFGAITESSKNKSLWLTFVKGIPVTFDAMEGTLEGADKLYYISNEHLQDGEMPTAIPPKDKVFNNWIIKKTNKPINDEHEHVVEPMDLYAVYRDADLSGIDDNTPIGGGWVYGDFIYGESSGSQEGVGGRPAVKGFSSTGLQKVKRHYELYIPHIDPKTKKTIEVIDTEAFKEKDLTHVIIPEGVVDIYPWAFSGNNLSELSLPSSVKFLGNFSFMSNQLSEINLNEGLETINSGVFAHNKLESISIPNSVKNIESTAFATNKLINVDLKEGLESLGDKSFAENLLKTVKIPLTLSKIHVDAFIQNEGLTNFENKVGLFIEDKSNPNNLKDGNGHVINPKIDNETTEESSELLNIVLDLVNLKQRLNVSDQDGLDVSNKETYVNRNTMNRLRESIYEGYYSYYDDEGKKYPIAETLKDLTKFKEELFNSIQNGKTKDNRSYHEFLLTVGIPDEGIEYPKDVSDRIPFVLESKDFSELKSYGPNKIIDAIPHTIFTSFRVPEGKYEFIAPVGKVLTKVENTVTVEENNPFVKVPEDIQDGNFSGIGFGMETGVVVIYDLMEHGYTDDKKIETIIRNSSPKNPPIIEAETGYTFKGWSLNGENIISDIKAYKVTGTTIFKAVYEEVVSDIVDNSILLEKIKEVENIVKDTAVSVDGKDVPVTEKWTTNENLKIIMDILEEIKKEMKTQEEVNNAISKLEEGLKIFNSNLKTGLKTLTNKEKLINLLKKAEEIVDQTTVSTNGQDVKNSEYWVTSEDSQWFLEKRAEANFVIEDEEATLEEIEEAYKNLQDHIESFNKKRKNGLKVDTELEEIIFVKDENSQCPEGYVRIVFNSGTSSFKENKKIVIFDIKRDLTWESIKKVVPTIFGDDVTFKKWCPNLPSDDITAKEGGKTFTAIFETEPQPKEVDKKLLVNLIKRLKAVKGHVYTEESYNKLLIALKDAESVLKNENLSQADINSAYSILIEARDNLELKSISPDVDKRELKAAINRGNSVIESLYTRESYLKFKEALNWAKYVYSSNNTTENDVIKAAKDLEYAISNLKIKQDSFIPVDKPVYEYIPTIKNTTKVNQDILDKFKVTSKPVFSDIENHWAKDYILKLANKDIIKGYEDGRFKPENNTTRAEFCTMVVRAFNLSGESEMSFKDINSSDWYYDAIKTMVSLELVKGISSYKFNAQESISRQELVSIIIRYIRSINPSLLNESSSINNKDIKEVSSWALEDIKMAISLGIIEGNEKGEIRPLDKASRAEVSKILIKTMELLEEKNKN